VALRAFYTGRPSIVRGCLILGGEEAENRAVKLKVDGVRNQQVIIARRSGSTSSSDDLLR